MTFHVSKIQILCVVALLIGIVNLYLHRAHEKRVSPISHSSSSLQTPNPEPSNSKVLLPSPLPLKPKTLEESFTLSHDKKHFLFCIVYIDSPINTRHSYIYLDSLKHLHKHFSPFEIVILAYHSDSTDTFVNGLYVSSAKKCEIKNNYNKPLIGINCLIESSFSTVDVLFTHNGIKANDVTSLYMVLSDFNLNRYFTPNLASSVIHLSRKYSDRFCAVSSQFVTKNSEIHKNIEDLSQDRTYNVMKIEALESQIVSSSTPSLNDLVIRTSEQPIVLIFPRIAYPSKNIFPNYILDGSNLWGQRLLDHFHLLSSVLPTIEITQSAYFFGGKNIVMKSPSEYNVKLDELTYRSTRGDLNKELQRSSLKLEGCPKKCNVVVRKKSLSVISVTNLSTDSHRDLIKDAKEQQGASDTLALLAIWESTLQSAFNWICWAKSTGLSSYLFVTYSEQVWVALNALNEPVHLLIEFQSSAMLGHQSDVDRVSNMLAYVHTVLLQSGMNVLVMSTNLLLMNDLSIKLIGDERCDVIILSEATEALFFIKPSEKGVLLLKSLVTYRNTFPKQSKNKYASMSRDYDLYKHVFTTKRLHNLELNMCKFSKGNVINSDYYFKRPEKRFGNPPLAFNLNERESSYLDIWNRDNNTCSYPAVIGAVPSNDREKWSLRIRILSSYRDKSFKRLLESLSNAYYESPLPIIPVDIVIDFPNVSSTDTDYSSLIERYNNVVKIAQSFVWPHGPVNVTAHKYCHGIVFAWLNSRLAPHEVLMVLEDDIEVSKYYYMYAVKAVNHFYVNPENYNPRLFGLSLQRQYHVVGETIFSYYEPYGPKIIDKALGGTTFYKYQLVSSWGPLFFPKPWNDFIDWVDSKVRSNTLVPCVPFLFSNHWALKGFVWTPFASRFIFENGLFIIYHHSRDGKALITNHKEPGLHFSNTSKVKQGVVPLVDSVGSLENILKRMPPKESRMRLYDFHFRYVSHENSLQLRNRFIDHGLNSCITIVRSKTKTTGKKSSRIEEKE